VAFHQIIPGLYEAHTQVLPRGRGEWSVKLVLSAAHYLFTRTEALEIFTRVPFGSPAALALTKSVGMRHEMDTQSVLPSQIFRATMQDWLAVAPGLVQRGREFHRKLYAEYDRLNLPVNKHGENDSHDRHVGAACEMILGNQVMKGISWYNRWAAMAFAPAIRVLSVNPLLIDIRDAVLKVEDGGFSVCLRQ
jgi:hypothetical protein